MIGAQASYNHKIFNSQYLGVKVFVAKLAESYSDTSTPTSLNDGTPSVLRVGAGAYYGYRYHLKTDFTLGANYLFDSLQRNYINNSYTANVSRVNIEASIGYLILPYLKISGTLASDISMTLGLGLVY